MLELYQNIKRLRLAHNWSQDELAAKTGYTDRSSIAKIESGKFDLPQSKILLFAEVLGVDAGYLMGSDGTAHSARRIPVLGRVAAGIPINAIEEIIDYEEIPEAMAKDGEYFGLQIHGNSMEPKFSDGDVVIARKQDDADDGDIVIALVNGNDAVCKRLRKYKDHSLALMSSNPSYEPMYFSTAEIDQIPVRIIGKVKELRAKF